MYLYIYRYLLFFTQEINPEENDDSSWLTALSSLMNAEAY